MGVSDLPSNHFRVGKPSILKRLPRDLCSKGSVRKGREREGKGQGDGGGGSTVGVDFGNDDGGRGGKGVGEFFVDWSERFTVAAPWLEEGC